MDTLGDSQISLTLNTYSHVLPAMQEDAVAKMDAMLHSANGSRVSSVRKPHERQPESLNLLGKSGEPGWNRTINPQIKSLLLCQLSYWPT